MIALDQLRDRFNGHITFKEKRPGILQVFAPLFHEDGDMIDTFLDLPSADSAAVRISDHALTLMRLSYNYEIDTPNKDRIFRRIVAENGVQEQNGTLFAALYQCHDVGVSLPGDPAVRPDRCRSVTTMASNMQLFRREVIQSQFFELLEEFIDDRLQRFHPRRNALPIPDRDDLEVFCAFETPRRPVYLFGIKDSSQARLVTISCLEFQRKRLPFSSIAVHEDFEALPRKDRTRVTNAADKQFTTLEDFKANAEEFLEREAA